MGKHSTPGERPDSEAIREDLPRFRAIEDGQPEVDVAKDVALKVVFLGEPVMALLGHQPYAAIQVGRDVDGVMEVQIIAGGGFAEDGVMLARQLHELGNLVADGLTAQENRIERDTGDVLSGLDAMLEAAAAVESHAREADAREDEAEHEGGHGAIVEGQLLPGDNDDE